MPTQEQMLELLELEHSGHPKRSTRVQCHTQRVTRGSNLDGGFAVTAQEPGCWVRRARDPESEHKVGDKLLSLGCYTSAFSSLGILCPKPPTRIYTIELRVTFILVQERTKFLRFDGQLRVDLKRKLGSILRVYLILLIRQLRCEHRRAQ